MNTEGQTHRQSISQTPTIPFTVPKGQQLARFGCLFHHAFDSQTVHTVYYIPHTAVSLGLVGFPDVMAGP